MAWYEAKLEQIPVSIETKVIDTFVGHTQITLAGAADAPPLIVLHGANMNGPAMANEIVAFSKTHRVYALDLIGMPGKSAESRLSLANDEYSRWLATVMDQLKLPCADFLGLSFGGWHVLKLAMFAPERIKRAVLLDSAGITPFTVKGREALIWTFVQCRRFSAEEKLSEVATHTFYAPGSTADLSLTKLMGLSYRHIKPDVESREISLFTPADLEGFSAPTMVFYGEKDVLFDAKQSITQAQALIGNLVAAEIVPGQGHFMGKEAQEQIYRKIETFLTNRLA